MRHGAHGLLPHTLAGRMPGVALNEAGRAQAAALGGWFCGSGVAAVVSSPLQRARETAGPIAAALGADLVIEPGFEEIDFGAWTGRRFEDLAGEPGWDAWNRLRSLVRCPGGETMLEAQSRALAAVGRWRERVGEGAVVVVSHSDVVKAMLAPALGLSLDMLHRVAIDVGSVSTMLVFDGDWRVDGVNWRVGVGSSL